MPAYKLNRKNKTTTSKTCGCLNTLGIHSVEVKWLMMSGIKWPTYISAAGLKMFQFIAKKKWFQNCTGVVVERPMDSHLKFPQTQVQYKGRGVLSLSNEAFICGLDIGLLWLSVNIRLCMYSRQASKHTLCTVWWRFLSISSRE